MDLTPPTLCEADALDALRLLPKSKAQLVYLDPTWFSDDQQITSPEGTSRPESLREYLQYISEVLLLSREALADTGLLVFHVEPTLSANTRYILDQIFGREEFRYEAILPLPQLVGRRPTVRHETLLYYSKSNRFKYSQPDRELSAEEAEERFPFQDLRGRYRLTDLTAASSPPHMQFPWKGITPPAGRVWKFSSETLNELESQDRLHYSKGSARPRLKDYFSEKDRIPIGSVWDDLPLRPLADERVNYPAQQPVALLERVLLTVSAPGDLIVDPFCGSGSMLVAAQSLSRQWVGADDSPDAIRATQERLEKSFGLRPNAGFMQLTLKRTGTEIEGAGALKVHLGVGDEPTFSRSTRAQNETKTYDFFISHAHEDKEDFVRPLAAELKARGHRVWYDEFTLSVGDSLALSIDNGLAHSRYGVVVLSPCFFSKEWPRRELGALVAREISQGKVILPIWHRVTRDEVLRNSPILADKYALNSSLRSIEQLAGELEEVLRND